MSTPRPKTQVSIAPERLVQLRKIAEVRGTSVSDVLHTFIREEMERLGIPLDVPGVAVSTQGDQVRIAANDFSMDLTRQIAGMMAERIREVRKSYDTALLKIGNNVKAQIRRNGPALQILNVDTGERYSAPPAIMEDLADVIEREAKA